MTKPLYPQQRGVSLLSLLLAVTLAASLFALALPGLGQVAAAARLRTEINALHHALHRARSESIKRNRYVVLCPSTDGERCHYDIDWSAGWLLYVESSQTTPPQRHSDERRLAVHRPARAVAVVANRRYFVARTRQYRATNGSFLACDVAQRVPGRALIVSYTGRPRARPEADLGGRLACP